MTFELFTKRDFSAYFSDTVSFFKLFGKNYFKNYFVINGFLLMILVVLLFFISKGYVAVISSTINGQNSNPAYFLDYYNNNIGVIISVFTVFSIVVLLLSIINITYPVVYLELMEENPQANFTSRELIVALKQNTGRMLLFILGVIFIIIPLMFLLFAFLVVLCFIIIGFPLLLIAFPAFMSWVALSYYEFIIKKVNFFTALGNGFTLIKLQFWPIVGTTFVMFLLIQILQGFITMLPYVIGLVLLFTSQDGMNGTDGVAIMGVLMSVVMVISLLLTYFFNNFLIVNQGLIYYSLREENENTKSTNNIDIIGTDFE